MKACLRGLGLVVICLWALSACTTVPQEGDNPVKREVSFTNTFWQLQHVGGEPVRAATSKEAPFIIFLDDGRVSGFTGCNRFKGAYGMVDGNFRFTEMSATRDPCPEGRHETPYLIAMKKTMGAEMDGNNLILLNESGQTLAVFEAFTGKPLKR
ncbi:META domain-containing protein [Marinobacter fonticola]|uniref:META domain-containing protein n=1 Tax=Marinobacter fonticola TaxID=2603215 RepID=UPI00143E007D|nr:META domain-containing protein [Marinobacter fonticola]